MKEEGWLLDSYIEDSQAVLWIKTLEGRVLKLVEPFFPDFYAMPKAISARQLCYLLSDHENIRHIEVERRFRTVAQREEVEVVHIHVDHIRNFRRVVSDVEGLKFVEGTYDTDLTHIQRYIFKKGVAPMERISFESINGKLLSLELVGGDRDVPPPPFTVMVFKVEHGENGIRPMLLLDEDLDPIEILEIEEGEILEELNSRLMTLDPDLLVCDPGVLCLLSENAKRMDIELSLGRETHTSRGRPKGRVHIGLKSFDRLGLVGVVERTRFTMAPASLSAEWPAGKTIDSRQCYEAYRRGILIPRAGFFQDPMTAEELVFRDQGGLVLSPEVSLHGNVGVLDFESMFPHIIVRRNVSYETVTPKGVDTSREGFLVGITKEPLERRLYFKHLRKRLPSRGREWLWCDQRQVALKEILVCIYGYSGCFANRFGNVATYQEINMNARDDLVRSMMIARGRGFELLYGDNDSLFLKRPDATSSDYKILAEEISAKVGLPMALDHHFKFLVLLPKKSNGSLGATKRYYGKLMDGSLFYRGIELRRHDTPPFLKDFQERLIEILLDAKDAARVRENLERAWDFVYETCRAIRKGDVDAEDLVISKVLRKDIGDYRGRLPHVVAAKQLSLHGEKIRSKDIIDFIYVNAGYPNPFRRVVPASMIKEGMVAYDRKKYSMLILDVAKTLMAPLNHGQVVNDRDILGWSFEKTLRQSKLEAYYITRKE